MWKSYITLKGIYQKIKFYLDIAKMFPFPDSINDFREMVKFWRAIFYSTEGKCKNCTKRGKGLEFGTNEAFIL